MKTLSLKQLCEECGVSRRAVQGYEKHGLVAAYSRNVYGHLLYSPETVQKVKHIKRMQSFGFTVKEIAAFPGLPKSHQTQLLLQKRADLMNKKDEINRAISEIDGLLNKET